MKRSRTKGVPDQGQHLGQQPEKSGWIRKFRGRGIFRELWRNRFVVLRGTHLFICDREVKDERKAREVLDLADYERAEELRKAKSRSKKDHSRFTLLRCRRPGSNVPNLVFLAFSPEEKESWVNAINVAIIKAKNRRVLDQVTIQEGGALAHPTRDRAKIPQGRRLPTRGHLLSVASTSCRGILTLDLVAEEDSYPLDVVDIDRPEGYRDVGCRRRADTDVSILRTTPKEPKVKTGSLPRGGGWYCSTTSNPEVCGAQKNQQVQFLQGQSLTPQLGKRSGEVQGRGRCASMDQGLSSRPDRIAPDLRGCLAQDESVDGAGERPVGQLQSLIAQRMQRAQEMLEEMRLQELQRTEAQKHRGTGGAGEAGGDRSYSHMKNLDFPQLHHLRSCDSPTCRSPGSRSRSSDSPRLRSKDSPRLRGRESPRTKAKKNRCNAGDSPRSRRRQSPVVKSNVSPCTSGMPDTSSKFPAKKSLPPPVSIGEGVSSQGSAADSLQLHHSPSTNTQGSPHGVWDTATFCLSQEKNVDVLPEVSRPTPVSPEEAEQRRAEAERLLQEAVSSWREAQEVLEEVRELQSQTLRRRRRGTYEEVISSLTAPAAEEEDTLMSSMTSAENDDEESP